MTIKFLSIAAIVLAPLGPLSGTVRAETPSYTIEDVTACSKDAMKLCRDKLPDLDAIEGCMKANFESLSPACRVRFEREKK